MLSLFQTHIASDNQFLLALFVNLGVHWLYLSINLSFILILNFFLYFPQD